MVNDQREDGQNLSLVIDPVFFFFQPLHRLFGAAQLMTMVQRLPPTWRGIF